jgi:mRNA interferase YafQ
VKHLIVYAKRFRKTVKKYQKSGNRYILDAVTEAIALLAVHDREALHALGTIWRDHALKGDKAGTRELHLSQDDLLLYRIDEVTSTIELLDIVSHEELRKQ